VFAEGGCDLRAMACDTPSHLCTLHAGVPKMLVLEYCANGCLLDVLKKKERNGDKFELAALMGILHCIASGMAYEDPPLFAMPASTLGNDSVRWRIHSCLSCPR
jgi:hypothetical protein